MSSWKVSEDPGFDSRVLHLFGIHATLCDEEAGPRGDPPERSSGWKEELEALQEKEL